MKKGKLKKISRGNYTVDEENCTTYLERKISNFYIKKLVIICHFDVCMKFMITLKSNEEETTKCIPIELLYSPSSWLAAYFDLHYYKKYVNNSLFDSYMVEILDLIIENLDDEEVYDDNICGWNINGEEYDFTYYNERDEMYEYINAGDRDIFALCLESPYAKTTIPVIAYTLLSVLSSLDIFGENNRINMIMSLTGSNERIRNKLAILLANLFERARNLSSAHYRHIHVYPDNKASEVRMKAMRCKDSVLIAFNPHKKQCNTLYKIYSPFERRKDDMNNGLLLIVKKDYNDIPFKTVNINIPDDFNIDTYFNMMYFELQLSDKLFMNQEYNIEYADLLMHTVYRFSLCITRELNNGKKSIKAIYGEYNEELASLRCLDNLTEEAYTYAEMLIFPLWMYLKLTESKNAADILQKCIDIISNTIRNSFPAKDDILDSEYEQAVAICKAFDRYFDKKSNHQYLGSIGVMPPNANEIKVWRDNNHIYVKSKTLSEILKLQDCEYKFTLKIKRALAQREMIETYSVSETERPEYTVHIQKPLYDNVKSRARFVAFKRPRCGTYGLFEFIDKIACPKSLDLDLRGNVTREEQPV